CLVEQYAAAGVQVVVLGRPAGADTLACEVYDAWTGARAFDGTLRLSNVTTAALDRQIDGIIRPIVQRGGLLDQRPALRPSPEPAARPAAPARSRRSEGTARVALLVGAIAVLLASPAGLALALVGRRELARRRPPASWKWSALLVMAFSAVAIAAAFLDL